MIAIGLYRIARLDGRYDIVQQILFEGGECGSCGENVAFGAVILLGSPVGHDNDHGCGLFRGDQIIKQVCGVSKSLPFGFITADPMQQIEDGIFFFG